MGLDKTSANDINFYDEAGYSNYDATRGDWQGATGTFTDFHLTFYTATTITISAITFFDSHMWQEVDSVTVYIQVPFDYWAFNMFLIFLGLVIVVASACLIAYSVRTGSVSRDRTMYLLFLFMLGWGLVLGGAMLG